MLETGQVMRGRAPSSILALAQQGNGDAKSKHFNLQGLQTSVKVTQKLTNMLNPQVRDHGRAAEEAQSAVVYRE